MAVLRKQSIPDEKVAALREQQLDFEQHLFPGAIRKEHENSGDVERSEQQRKAGIEKQVNAFEKEADVEGPSKTPRKSIDPSERERRKKKQLEDKVAPYLYDNKQSHPIIEYKPSKEEVESSAITPSFVLEVTWPRIVEFYHPSSPHCTEFQSTYISIARGIKHLSSRLPVEFYAVNCARYREVCEYGFNIETVPSLIGLKSGRIEWSEIEIPSDDVDEDELVQYVADTIDVTLDEVVHHSAEIDSVGSENNEEHMARFIANSLLYKDKVTISKASLSIPQSEEIFHDAMSSFVVTLTSSLYSQLPHGSALPPDRSIALREFVDLVRWAYPPETQVHELAQHLADEFFAISTSEAGLLGVISQHTSIHEGMSWSTRCSGADSSQDGYSCGLWMLLHIISLGVKERHDAVVGDIDRLSVSYAGHVMRSFIDEFFIHCETCRQLWIALYDEACCELHNSDHSIADKTTSDSNNKDQDWRQLALWVWEIHNEITVRTKHAAGKGYYSKYSHIASTKLLWPSPIDCPMCWQSTGNGNGQTTNMNSYDPDATYNHLKKTYWPRGIHNNRHILLDKWTKAKRHLSMQHLRQRMRSTRGLTVNIVLWVLCICWLILTKCKQPYRTSQRRKVKAQYYDEDIDGCSFERNHMQRNPRNTFRTQHAIKRSNGRSRFGGSRYNSRSYQL